MKEAAFKYEKEIVYNGLNLVVRGQNFDEYFSMTQGGLEFNGKVEILAKVGADELPWGVNMPLNYSDIPNEKIKEVVEAVANHISIYDPKKK